MDSITFLIAKVYDFFGKNYFFITAENAIINNTADIDYIIKNYEYSLIIGRVQYKTYENLAELYFLYKRDFDKAIYYCKLGLELDRNNFKLSEFLGRLYFFKLNYNEAIYYFENANLIKGKLEGSNLDYLAKSYKKINDLKKYSVIRKHVDNYFLDEIKQYQLVYSYVSYIKFLLEVDDDENAIFYTLLAIKSGISLVSLVEILNPLSEKIKYSNNKIEDGGLFVQNQIDYLKMIKDKLLISGYTTREDEETYFYQLGHENGHYESIGLEFSFGFGSHLIFILKEEISKHVFNDLNEGIRLHFLALLQASDHEFENAIYSYTRIIGNEYFIHDLKSLHMIYFNRSVLCFLKKRYFEAFYDINKSIELDSAFGPGYKVRSQIKYYLYNIKQLSYEDLNKDVNGYLKDAKMYYNLTGSNYLDINVNVLMLKMENLPELFEKINSYKSQYFSAFFYYQTNQFDKTIERLEKLTLNAPLCAESYLLIAKSYLHINNINLAKNNIEKALQINPDFMEASILYSALEHLLKFYDEFNNIKPNNEAQLYKDKGEKEYNAGLYNNAYLSYSMAISIEPTDNIYYRRALVSVKLKEFSKANFDFFNALELSKSPEYIQQYLGSRFFNSALERYRFKNGLFSEREDDVRRLNSINQI